MTTPPDSVEVMEIRFRLVPPAPPDWFVEWCERMDAAEARDAADATEDDES